MTVTKVRWLARERTRERRPDAGVVLPHDWLTWQLGAAASSPATDRGDASGTCYFDATSERYRDDLVELALGRELGLPRVAAPAEVVGETPDGDRSPPAPGTTWPPRSGLGLDPGARRLARHQRDGLRPSATPDHEPTGTVAGFADATGAFLPLVCTLNGARNLAAAAKLIGCRLGGLQRLALSAPAGCEGRPTCRTWPASVPHRCPTPRVSWPGMTLRNLNPENVARAAIEGVLWSLALRGARWRRAVPGRSTRSS